MSDPGLVTAMQNIPDNILSRLAALERKVEEQQSREGVPLEQITDGEVSIVDLLVSPNDETVVTEVTNPGFTGLFFGGSGEVFSEGTFVMGGVGGGVLKWGCDKNGNLIANSITLNNLQVDASVMTSILGWLLQQTGTIAAETRVLKMGLQANLANTQPEGLIQFYKPGAAVTVPNGDFASLDMTGWRTMQNPATQAALGTLSTAFTVRCSAVMGTNLYVGISSGTTTSAVWMWNGITWSAVGTLGTGNLVYALCVIGTDLYAGITGGFTTSSVWKWDGVNWTAVGTLAYGSNSLMPIGANLYAGVNQSLGYTSGVWKWDGANWTAVGTLTMNIGGSVISLITDGANIYAGLSASSKITSSVWKWNGASWTALGTLGTGANVQSLVFVGTDLYAGITPGTITTSTVWKWNGVAWAAVGTLSTLFFVTSLVVIGTDIYAGISNGATTSAVWKWNGIEWAALGTLSTAFLVYALSVIGNDVYAVGGSFTTSAAWKFTEDWTAWTAANGYAEISVNAGFTTGIKNIAAFAVTAGQSYNFTSRSWASAPAGTATVTVKVKFYTSASGGSLVSTVTLWARTGANLLWRNDSQVIVAPATATYAIFTAEAVSAGDALSVRFDDFTVTAVTFSQLRFADDGLFYTPIGGLESKINALPVVVDLDAGLMKFSGTGFARSVTANQAYAYYMNASAANANNGDIYSIGFILAPGTYTLGLLGVTHSAAGKTDVYLNGVLQSSAIDWYSGGTVYNVVKTSTITATAGGYQKLELVVNGKNASSTDYILSITRILIYPSAY